MSKKKHHRRKHLGHHSPRKATADTRSDNDMVDLESVRSGSPLPQGPRSTNNHNHSHNHNNTSGRVPNSRGGGSNQQNKPQNNNRPNYHPRAETFNTKCPACAMTLRLNRSLRVTLETFFRRCHDALERWADDVGVGSGRTIDPMEWQAEMTTLVLERERRPSEMRRALEIHGGVSPPHQQEVSGQCMPDLAGLAGSARGLGLGLGLLGTTTPPAQNIPVRMTPLLATPPRMTPLQNMALQATPIPGPGLRSRLELEPGFRQTQTQIDTLGILIPPLALLNPATATQSAALVCVPEAGDQAEDAGIAPKTSLAEYRARGGSGKGGDGSVEGHKAVRSAPKPHRHRTYAHL